MKYIGIANVKDWRVELMVACCECGQDLEGHEIACPRCGRALDRMPTSISESGLCEYLNRLIWSDLYGGCAES